MTKSWEFEKDHENIEIAQKKMEVELSKRKVNLLKKLIGSKVKIGFKSYSTGLGAYIITVEGTLTEVNFTYVKLDNPKPDIWNQVGIDDIRTIERII